MLMTSTITVTLPLCIETGSACEPEGHDREAYWWFCKGVHFPVPCLFLMFTLLLCKSRLSETKLHDPERAETQVTMKSKFQLRVVVRNQWIVWARQRRANPAEKQSAEGLISANFTPACLTPYHPAIWQKTACFLCSYNKKCCTSRYRMYFAWAKFLFFFYNDKQFYYSRSKDKALIFWSIFDCDYSAWTDISSDFSSDKQTNWQKIYRHQN